MSWEFTGQAVPAQPGWELVTLRDVSGRPEDYTMNREAIHAWGVYARRGTASGEFDLRPMTVRPMTAADQNGRACALWYGPDHLENDVVVGVVQMGQHPPVADIDAAAETLRTRHKLAVQDEGPSMLTAAVAGGKGGTGTTTGHAALVAETPSRLKA